MVREGTLSTPSVDCGLLPGVTRAFVLELAARSGIRAFEEDVAVARLRQADEVFLTNSLIEIVAVRETDGRMVGHGGEGPLTATLRTAYRKHIT
jgi:branched-subunit amino acid aminotransferase/4-amino-4-deoxychorismate lyase